MDSPSGLACLCDFFGILLAIDCLPEGILRSSVSNRSHHSLQDLLNYAANEILLSLPATLRQMHHGLVKSPQIISVEPDGRRPKAHS